MVVRVSSAAAFSVPGTAPVYSQRPDVRVAARTAGGGRPAAAIGPVPWIECETGGEVVEAVSAGGVGLCTLDGGTQPAGGLALARQLDHEVADRAVVCVLIARQPDRWLAHWSRAEATLPLPVDPLTAPGVVADLLRSQAQHPTVRR